MTRKENIELWGSLGGTSRKIAKSLEKAILEEDTKTIMISKSAFYNDEGHQYDLFVEGNHIGKGVWASNYIYHTMGLIEALKNQVKWAEEEKSEQRLSKARQYKEQIKNLEARLSSYKFLAKGILETIEKL